MITERLALYIILTNFLGKKTKIFEHYQAKTKRYPDVINIGVEKCGTGFLRKVFLEHPKFKFPELAEMQFFSHKWSKGREYYK